MERLHIPIMFITVMDVSKKTKDNIKSRRDLAHYFKRRRFHVVKSVSPNGKPQLLMSEAPFILEKNQRKMLCDWVKGL